MVSDRPVPLLHGRLRTGGASGGLSPVSGPPTMMGRPRHGPPRRQWEHLPLPASLPSPSLPAGAAHAAGLGLDLGSSSHDTDRPQGCPAWAARGTRSGLTLRFLPAVVPRGTSQSECCGGGGGGHVRVSHTQPRTIKSGVDSVPTGKVVPDLRGRSGSTFSPPTRGRTPPSPSSVDLHQTITL